MLMPINCPTDPSSTTQDRALVISSDQNVRMMLKQVLQLAQWQVDCCAGVAEFYSLSESLSWTLVFLADDPQSDLSQAVQEKLWPQITAEQTYLVIISENPSTAGAMHWLQHGAMDYLAWPIAPGELVEIGERMRRLSRYGRAANTVSRCCSISENHEKTGTDRPLLGKSAAMLELSRQLVKIARAPNLRVFLTGETGTGKEVVAQHIHKLSGQPGPFIVVNCAATVESLLESDLFGHEKGSFTGAHARKRGLWEEAANGTLFLDEITETSPAVQAKLLRVLQEGVIRRVGSNQEIKATARVIAATNKDVLKAVNEGAFREDLYFRLGHVLRLPPLRERREDIPLLVEHFCHRSQKETMITPEAMEILCAYDWPGNVRQLETVIQQIITFAERIILPEDVFRQLPHERSEMKDILLPFWSVLYTLRKGEWPTILELRNWYVLQAYRFLGKETVVAKHLGLDVRTVASILEKEAVYNQTNLRGLNGSDSNREERKIDLSSHLTSSMTSPHNQALK